MLAAANAAAAAFADARYSSISSPLHRTAQQQIDDSPGNRNSESSRSSNDSSGKRPTRKTH
jgi:hypothetical protein